MQLRVLSEQDVRTCLTMAQAIELMGQAFKALSAGEIVSPLRTTITPDRGTMLYKPAYWAQANLFCCKNVAVFPDNRTRGLPVTPGTVHVNDGQTGMPLAMLEAGYLTSLRTGAATGLATRLLAPPSTTAAALFGTGGQAFHQLEAMLTVLDLRGVHVFSRSIDRARQFCERHQAQFANCELIPTVSRTGLAACQLITCATTSPVPVFEDQELGPTVHINAVGSLGPERTEVPLATIARARVIVDHREACLQEAGEICLARAEGRLPQDCWPAELGELVSQQATDCTSTTGRTPSVSVFKSVGNAAQDIVCVAHILRQAESEGLGQLIEL